MLVVRATRSALYPAPEAVCKNVSFATCSICGDPIVALGTLVLLSACEHPAHEHCCSGKDFVRCVRCSPPPGAVARALVPLTWFVGAQFGAHAMLLGDYRACIMHATSFGLYTIAVFFVSVLPVIKRVVPDVLPVAYMSATTLLFGGSTARSAAYAPVYYALAPVSAWIAGLACVSPVLVYQKPAADFLVCTASLAVAVWLVETHAFMDSLVIMVCAARWLWRWPTIWDVHCGNCCGLWSIFLFVMLVVLAPSFALVLFEDQRPVVLTYALSKTFLERHNPEVDPFTAPMSYVCSIVCLAVLVRAVLLRV